MDRHVMQKLQNQFEALGHRIPDADVKFWFARDLQEPLDYIKWENFLTAVKRAFESSEAIGDVYL
ncbi:MAG: hypothetical protein V2B19_02290 [Pseudomonadota bacterium]